MKLAVEQAPMRKARFPAQRKAFEVVNKRVWGRLGNERGSANKGASQDRRGGGEHASREVGRAKDGGIGVSGEWH